MLSEKDKHQQKQPVCDCEHFVQLTQAGSLLELNDCLVGLVTEIVSGSGTEFGADLGASTEVRLGRADESYFGEQKNTRFELPIDEEKPLALVVNQMLTSVIKSQIECLCRVYINQYNLISRVNHDQLTKLGNRQAMENKFLEIFGVNSQNQRRNNETDYYLAILDIDHFKQVNDNFGHLHGDEILLQFSRLMLNTFRDSDLLYRYGGEEFVVLLTDIKRADAEMVLERFRKITSQYQFPLLDSVTVSIGFTHLELESGASDTLGRADKALYYAKENGRNQLHMYETLLASEKIQSVDSQEDDITFF